jgi:GTP-binding protein EngB required for normal cell division
VHASLDQPLRVAVAGRLKAGKSTLVNALLGQRIAATDVAECTKVVTQYQYGFPERVEVRHRDGSRHELPLELDSNGAARIPLDVEAAEVDSVVVWLSNDALRDLTLIDTPGLASLTPGVSQRTTELLAIDDASRTAIAQAHAVVFLISQSPKRDEVESLTALRAAFGGVGGSAVNAIGVLTKADKMSDASDEDPWQVAVRITEQYAADPALRTVVATVLPVIGLLAETAESGLLTEADVRNLRSFTGMEGSQRDILLLGADAFIASAGPVPRDQAERLLAALDLYGLRRALNFLDEQDADATSLHRHLRRISGIDRLRRLLDESFGARADVLKADAACSALERLVHELPMGSDTASHVALRDMLEKIRLDPATHALNEVRALRMCATDDAINLPPELADDLHRVLTETAVARRLGFNDGVGTALLQEAALRGAARWNAFRNAGRASPNEARVADIVSRTYALLWEAADAPAVAR